ncbi:PucR family transcriptional regulator [Ruicaihuangia caeni]|uniref:Helix-turn-helix domain-containing protein n=1 Tax=Ruicaihuangia caeni TaxID=3042517 RepID=A0AAW6T4U5_9MICO|nr:helix-turn-helix domain-containing protein [Klugiella sp. YN-L-19]MDI2097393.1 helix-turn-helix domain-containing protein [Klugiella sp. YN-L-19]
METDFDGTIVAHPDTDVVDTILGRVRPLLPHYATMAAEEYGRRFQDYARLSPAAFESVIESSFANLRALVEAIKSEAERPAFNSVSWERIGAIRMRQGISIESLMRSYNVWGRFAWAMFLSQIRRDDRRELETLLYISARLFWHIENATGSMAAGFIREAQSTWSNRELTRNSLVDALITGKLDGGALSAEPYGKDLASSYVAIAMLPRRAGAAQSPSLEDHVRRVYQIATRIRSDHRAFAGVRDSSVFLLWPVDDAVGQKTLGPVARELAERFSTMGVGVGAAHPGLEDVRLSFEEAQEASHIAVALDTGEPLSFNDLRLERLARSSGLIQEMSRDALGPLLEYERRRPSALVDTLRAYIDAGGNISGAAESMFVHANTVIYRLKRIAEITGLDPRESRGLLVLSLSLLAYQIGTDRPGTEG